MTDYYIPPFEPFALDRAFCSNTKCPFKKCLRHSENLGKYGQQSKHVSICDFSRICQTYVKFLAGEVEKNHDT